MGAVEWCLAPCTLYAHGKGLWPLLMNVWPYIVDISQIMLVDGVLLRINPLLSGVEH